MQHEWSSSANGLNLRIGCHWYGVTLLRSSIATDGRGDIIAQMPLNPHHVIDHYEIISLIGSGGMGEVYRARDTRLNRDVAIKVLPGLSTADPDRLRRFEQEARAAAALNHPNILAVYQMGIHQGAPYLVSELLEGETLRDRLKRGPLPIRKVVDYGIQIAKGLAAAHEKGIVHRDLKPENLFLTNDGQAKILDFGLARLTQMNEAMPAQSAHEVKTVAGMLMGSMGYMSPEQVRGQVADHRSDIFTFSAVLYEMLTGQRAFQKATSIDAMSAILNEEPTTLTQFLPNAPPGLERVVQRGLEKNPEQRFQSASDLGFALEAAAGPLQSVYTSNYRIEGKRPVWTRGFLLAIGGAIALILVAIAYSWLRPVPAPQVANYVQLTHDGLQKSLIGTDGSRLFLTVVDSGAEATAAIPVSGGEEMGIPMPSPGMFPVDVSPDGSRFLLVDGTGFPPTGPLWTLPVLGDSPRRLGDAAGNVGAFSADGKELAYGKGPAVFVAKADGSDSHLIATMQNFVSGLSISPDGSTSACGDRRDFAERLERSRGREVNLGGEPERRQDTTLGSRLAEFDKRVLRPVDPGREVFRLPVWWSDLGTSWCGRVSAAGCQAGSVDVESDGSCNRRCRARTARNCLLWG